MKPLSFANRSHGCVWLMKLIFHPRIRTITLHSSRPVGCWPLTPAFVSAHARGQRTDVVHGRRKVAVDTFMLDSLSGSLPLLVFLYGTTRLGILIRNAS
jgi:hypothetical protein